MCQSDLISNLLGNADMRKESLRRRVFGVSNATSCQFFYFGYQRTVNDMEALNNDFRYQLTVIGTFAQAMVATEIKDNRFTIKTSAPGVKVSWMVTGIRRDAFANKYRIPTEEAKPERERGFYLHPKAFNQPAEKAVEWARDPETMSKLPKP